VAINPHAQFDVFAHSWNPPLARLIDGLWSPVWSTHQPQWRNLSKVASAALSLRRALEAKVTRESQRSARYALVLAMRHDVFFTTPFELAALPRAQLWLAAGCCKHTPRVMSSARDRQAARELPSRVREACLSRTNFGQEAIDGDDGLLLRLPHPRTRGICSLHPGGGTTLRR